MIRLVCTGKIKTCYWREAASHYLDQLNRFRQIEYVEVRDASSSLTANERLAQEARNIRASLSPGAFIIGMHEAGAQMTSSEFANFLKRHDESASRKLNFVIGGPFGFEKSFLETCDLLFSLSQCTWPHELARVLLLEQLYRAETILRGFPYHH